MKVLLISDIHLKPYRIGGYENFQKMFSYLESVCVDQQIQLMLFGGDMFDARGNVPYDAYTIAMRFIKNLLDRGVGIRATVGNHDRLGSYNDYTTHSMQPFGVAFPQKFKCYKEPVYGFSAEGLEYVADMYDGEDIKQEEGIYNVAVLHHDVVGYDFGNYVNDEGLDLTKFTAVCDLVCVGHYHNPSRNGKVVYLGSLHHMTRNDANTTKYYYILDTETAQLEAYKMPQYHPRYLKVSFDSVDSFTFDNLENSIVCFESDADIPQEQIAELLEAVKDAGAVSAEFKLKSSARKAVVALDAPSDVANVADTINIMEEWLRKKDHTVDVVDRAKRVVKEILHAN